MALKTAGFKAPTEPERLVTKTAAFSFTSGHLFLLWNRVLVAFLMEEDINLNLRGQS